MSAANLANLSSRRMPGSRATGLLRRLRLLAKTAILCFAFTSALAKDEPPAVGIAGLTVAVWLPAHPAGAPVVLFSHGFHGCATQSVFLMQALADAGYAVFAPNHKDAACYGGESSWLSRSELPFHDADSWTANTYADRRDDMRKLLDALPKDVRYRMLDFSRVGLAGHSLGGYTVLALGGAWDSWRDSRAKAVLALSPYSQPFMVQHTLSGIHVPVMYQGGTRDTGITPFVNKEGGAYDQTPAPKYYVELDGSGHFGWTGLRSTFHGTIDRYAIAFFDAYLKGKPFPAELTHPSGDVSVVRVNLK